MNLPSSSYCSRVWYKFGINTSGLLSKKNSVLSTPSSIPSFQRLSASLSPSRHSSTSASPSSWSLSPSHHLLLQENFPIDIAPSILLLQRLHRQKTRSTSSARLFSTSSSLHNKENPLDSPPEAKGNNSNNSNKPNDGKQTIIESPPKMASLTPSHPHTHTHTEEHHSLFSHSHSHGGHHQPNELLSTSTASIMSNPAVRITWIGLIVNVAMAASKGVGGVYFHSQALVADAIHSVSDMFADFLTLATVNVASKVGTPVRFPLGYGKIETVGSLMVSFVLLFAGISVGWSSLLQVFEFFLPTYLFEYVNMIHIGHSHSHTNLSIGDSGSSHSHSHGSLAVHDGNHGEPISSTISTREIPNINAAWLAGASIIVKELLYRKTMKVATETNSKVLVANAWHHRVDSLTALVALITVAGGVLFNIAWLDSIGGICVSILIIKAGWGTFKSAWFELVDRGEKPGSEDYDKIEGIINEEIEANKLFDSLKLTQLSVMTSGANTNIYATLTTQTNFDLKTLNRIETSLSDLIRKDDKFVRNIYLSFKNASEAETNKELQEKHEHADTKEHEHEHTHQDTTTSSEHGHSH